MAFTQYTESRSHGCSGSHWMKPTFLKLTAEYLLFTRHSPNEMRPAHLLRFQFSCHHKPELQSVPVMIWLNIAALKVSYVGEGFEGHKTGECYGPFLEIGQPSISLCKMSLLQHRPCRNKLVERVDRIREREAINFLDLIGHQENAFMIEAMRSFSWRLELDARFISPGTTVLNPFGLCHLSRPSIGQ
jgi:hypothetical protein